MITIVGLGPSGYDRIPGQVRDIVEDRGNQVIVRTIHHPAAATLAGIRDIETCDDLYETGDSFETVYQAIADRVLERSTAGDVVYAVPGSPLVGEYAVRKLIASSDEITLIPGESFVDYLLARTGYDPMERGLQLLNAHDLPDPLVLDMPTIIAQLDTPHSMADTTALIGQMIPEGEPIWLFSGETGPVIAEPGEIDSSLAGPRTSMFIDVEPGGLIGAVRTVRLLRAECPWDREQTHQTLVKNLVEEAYELVDALHGLPADGEPDWTAYAAVEDELGDVLLQVLMHEAVGREAGALDINVIAEGLRRKLVRRHPHVFGDAEVEDAAEVKANWDRIKMGEGSGAGGSLLDGVPASLPALQRAGKIQNRAARIGFDWESAGQVIPKVIEELDEVSAALETDPDAVADEIGDVLFSVVNLARHVGVDPELALRSSIERFETRFRAMEAEGPMGDLTLEELDERWNRAKGC